LPHTIQRLDKKNTSKKYNNIMSKIILPQTAHTDKENLLNKVDFKAIQTDLKVKKVIWKRFQTSVSKVV